MSNFLNVPQSFFSDCYGESRRRFLKACASARVETRSYVNPVKGPEGEELATDVAWFGNPAARKVSLVISGTHGLEGLTGSACQLNWIESRQYDRLQPDTAVLLVHAINPYGVAWLQRETEEGVDLNRNFIDHSGRYPQRPLYAEIHPALLCAERDGPEFERARAFLGAFREKHGQMGFLQAFLGGQYDFPEGMCYGGRSASWSNRTLTSILKERCAAVIHLAVLDYHTGLGPWGHASIVVHDVAEGDLARKVRRWYGPSVWPVSSPDPAAKSFIAETGKGCRSALPGAEVTPVTVEYGTYDIETEIDVLQRELWLRNHGDRNSPIGRKIKSDLIEYFYPNDSYWRELVLCRSQQVIQQSLEGLDGRAD